LGLELAIEISGLESDCLMTINKMFTVSVIPMGFIGMGSTTLVP